MMDLNTHIYLYYRIMNLKLLIKNSYCDVSEIHIHLSHMVFQKMILGSNELKTYHYPIRLFLL